MKKAVYPGSFDPITMGHIDIIKRIAQIFSEVIVLVADSSQKTGLFTPEERQQLAQEALKDLPNVRVDIHDGLTVDYLKKHQASVIVRGLRAVVDFEYEMTMASMNKKISPEFETMLIFANPEYYYISSRGVKEVARHDGPLYGLVPESVIPALKTRIKKSGG